MHQTMRTTISQQVNKMLFTTKDASQLVHSNSITNQFFSEADKGIITGTFKGDNLAYQVTLFSDSSNPWIADINLVIEKI